MVQTFTPTRTVPALPGASLLGLKATTLLNLGEAVHNGFELSTLEQLTKHVGLSLGEMLSLMVHWGQRW